MSSRKGIPKDGMNPERAAAIARGLLGGTECIQAGGALTEQGYGRAQWQRRDSKAHIVVWLMAGRGIPEGYTLDHACHDPSECAGGNACPHRACVNIDHLRLATRLEQVQNSVATYQDACANGHAWPENRVVYPSGHTACVACLKDRRRTPEARARNAARMRRRRAGEV